ncbi:protein kinase domain-containing protein [Singulisphaera acidiphila]|uniref:non-specific serine/threonine protein kinase n=1 Tax=Singulisphaera acidiphila (strain ATCC BAA-1392 / DSM 18658 / VKM B-2454 / MOB10) TaxID=886293 RepID=L0D605_SINAD|nr:protein kinase [Singulisphaera acidiphila]AGA24692.1 serine/threonine protein kinase [Singulisphaera acidiphila DSM 18658]
MPLSLAPGVIPVPGYSLARLLGRGGFGEVWEAVAPGGVRVAMKFVRVNPQEAGPEERALEIVSNIRHPHLLDIQFAARVEDYLVIAMPLCEKSLWDRLRECRDQGLPGLPYDELIGYMDEMASAVDYLNEPRHEAGDGRKVGVQHRDIKPHNIFLVGGSTRLADFGVAKILEGRAGDHTGNMSPHYVAPEVLDGRMCQQTDQYSLAMTYCHLRTGRLPFRGDSINQILYAHLHQLADLSGLPEPEQNVVTRSLAKEPDDRWPNCRAFVRALQAASLREGSPPSYGAAGPLPMTVSPGRLETTSETHLAISSQHPPLPDSQTQSLYEAQGTTQRTDVAPPAPSRRWRNRLIGGGVAAALAGGAFALMPMLRSDKVPAPPVAPQSADASARPVPVVDAALPAVSTDPPPVTPPPVRARDTSKPEQAQPPVVQGESPPTTDTTESQVDRRPPPASPPASALPDRPDRETPQLASLLVTPRTPEPEGDLAVKAHGLLKKYCYRCHGVRFEVPGYNVLDHDILVAKRGEEEQPYVVPGKPAESAMWDRVGVEKDMPPSGPKPTEADRALIGRWIAAGALFPAANPVDRPLKGEHDVVVAVRDYLRPLRETDRAFLRFFTIHNLYNNKSISDDDLRLARAAVAKLVNSLSWKTDIAVPKPIDREQTVFALDLRDVGWDEQDRWNEMLSHYPYGLKHDKVQDQATREAAKEVYTLAQTSMPYVRADWFVANASRPPLYHALLEIPENLQALEKKLAVDPCADFLRNKLARAGFATSGVSSQNRLVDRHPASYGAYWKSYDFKKNEGTGNLFRYPLGPVFEGNPFPRQAFEHAGGEIVFNLPNGLQGYVLVDGKDQRIDAGPIEVVGDALKTAGTSAIVPGLSCMACHQLGIVPFKDTIREGLAVAGEAGEKVEMLYPEKAVMDRLITKDQARYLKALEEATGSFLMQGEDREKPIRDFPESVGAIARTYLKDLGPEDVAAEFGVSDPKEMVAMIRANKKLRQLGLSPLLSGAAIKRTDWDSLEGRAISTFQEAAHELGMGSPFRAY